MYGDVRPSGFERFGQDFTAIVATVVDKQEVTTESTRRSVYLSRFVG